MLKGWIDRVFVSGLFYGGKRIYGEGGMAGRKALVLASLGGREHMFGDGAIHGPLADGMLRHLLQGSLGYVGYEVLEPFFACHVPYLPEEERRAILDRLRAHVAQVDALPSLRMPDLAAFDDTFRPKAAP
jgi:NAD(P)H dehydrogenase (quinone)